VDDNITGPQFIKTMIPILDELNKRNGIGKSNEIIESVIKNLNITDKKLFEKYKSGQTRIYNQICWARNYLVEAGFISKEKRGIWELTEKGKNTILVEKDLIPLFKSVQDKFKNKSENIDFDENIPDDVIQYWAIALGENARLWEECFNNEIIAIGWDYLQDLSLYKSKEDIRVKIKAIEKSNSSKKNDALACWQFYNEIEIGDYVFVKKGNNEILGYGKIISNYFFDNIRKEYKHLRKVEWLNKGKWQIEENFALKTLTNITPYPNFINLILGKIGIKSIDEKLNNYVQPFESYTKENALSELFIESDKFETILTTLKRKKNIILQGSPGVGKTFFAKRLAYTMIGFKDSSKLNMIQFHQSYSYEDFMQGFRPTEEGKFLLKNGIFYEFCQRAAKDAENPYVFIIDEINRGNLSKIFGELMMLIESDKRGEDFSIPLTYSKDETETFYVPENVYVIGTMNTADRSLAIVDYALRRRFSFIDIEPAYNKQSFLEYLEKNKISKELIGRINLKFANLNQLIEKDNRLGKGFRIGHSYFSVNIETDNQIEWYKSIVQMEIAPLLVEYWFDDEIQATGQIEKLLEI